MLEEETMKNCFSKIKKKFKSSEKNSVINVVPIRKTWAGIAQSV